MALTLEELWQSASDDELTKARENFEGITEGAQQVILAELAKRALQVDLWTCVNCGIENPKRFPECRECGSDEQGNTPEIEYHSPNLVTRQCVFCGKETQPIRGLLEWEAFAYCLKCARQESSKVLVSTTPTLEGYRVKRYIDIQSVEVVIGTGPLSEFREAVADFLGNRCTDFERKLQRAKRAALENLRLLALHSMGNAVIGIDLDYAEFSSNRIAVVANGTIVEVEKK